MDEGTVIEFLSKLGAKKIQRSNSGVLSSCPFAPWTHKGGLDKKPSFSMKVDPSGESVWYCFTCQRKGKAKGLLYQMKEFTGSLNMELLSMLSDRQGSSPWSRFKKLSDWDTSTPDTGFNSDSSDYWHVEGYEKKFELSEIEPFMGRIPQYALERGITKEQAIKWKLGYDEPNGRLIFPIFDFEKKFCGWTGRAIYQDQIPKYMHAEGLRRDKVMYGECFVDLRQRTGYIMEGLMDVLNLERMGMKNCLAVFGTACSKIHVEKLSGWFNEVVIFPHNDEENMRGEKAGFKMAQQYHDALKLMGVSVLIAPVIENKKDPGEWTADDLKWVLDRLQEYREV